MGGFVALAVGPPTPTNVGLTGPGWAFGPWLIGVVIDCVLLGATLLMAIEYFGRHPRDKLSLKMFVAGVLLLNVLKSAQNVASLWIKLINGFGNPTPIILSSWCASATVLTSQIVTSVSQAFFMHRMYALSGRNWIVLSLAIPLALLALAATIALSVNIFLHRGTIDENNLLIRLAFAGILSSDGLITILTTYYLLRAKTGLDSTTSLTTRLVRLTWMTALPPAICATLNAVLYFGEGVGNTSFSVFAIILPKLYAISLLYTLNERAAMRAAHANAVFAGPTTRRGRDISLRGLSTDVPISLPALSARGATRSLALAHSDNRSRAPAESRHVVDVDELAKEGHVDCLSGQSFAAAHAYEAGEWTGWKPSSDVGLAV